MPRPQILEERPINMSELKSELAKIKRKEKELGFRANKTMEYLNQFATLSEKKAKELYESIEKLGIPRLRELHINKIIDLMPKSAEDVKVILQGYTVTVKKDDMQRIVDVVKKFE